MRLQSTARATGATLQGHRRRVMPCKAGLGGLHAAMHPRRRLCGCCCMRQCCRSKLGQRAPRDGTLEPKRSGAGLPSRSPAEVMGCERMPLYVTYLDHSLHYAVCLSLAVWCGKVWNRSAGPATTTANRSAREFFEKGDAHSQRLTNIPHYAGVFWQWLPFFQSRRGFPLPQGVGIRCRNAPK